MTVLYYAFLPVILASAAGTVPEEYDIIEEPQFDTSTYVTLNAADFDAPHAWLEEEEEGEDDDTEISIPVEQNLCPPPPPASLQMKTQELCNLTLCSHNGNCSSNKENETLICCFNGCVQTCMHPINPPIAFDWVEESPDIKKALTPEHSQSAHSSPPEAIVLPGGCFLSNAQMSDLETFKENQHVSHCFCNIGNVLCKINKR